MSRIVVQKRKELIPPISVPAQTKPILTTITVTCRICVSTIHSKVDWARKHTILRLHLLLRSLHSLILPIIRNMRLIQDPHQALWIHRRGMIEICSGDDAEEEGDIAGNDERRCLLPLRCALVLHALLLI
jgi:hypothetical protein